MTERRYTAGEKPVPGFVLVRFLGAGNFGEVWEARAPGNVRAALKILYGIDRKAGRKAFSALQLVKNLRNPHLVTIMGFWLKDEKGEILDDDVDPNFSEDSTVSGIPPALDDDENITKTLRPIQRTPVESDRGDEDLIRTSPGSLDRPAELIIAMGLADETLDDCLKRYNAEREATGASRSGKGSNTGLMGIPRDELLYYLEGAAKGLDFLNCEKQIQHGDIKPQNLMIVSGEGQVSDFDLARTTVNIQATTTKVGSLAYMAPEVFESGVPTNASDQYALAITYYELRTGRLPYRNLSYAAVIGDKVRGNLDLSLLPPAERKVIQKATSLKPAARYASCGEMVKALRRGPARPFRQLLKTTTVLAVVLIAAGGLAMWLFPDWFGGGHAARERTWANLNKHLKGPFIVNEASALREATFTTAKSNLQSLADLQRHAKDSSADERKRLVTANQELIRKGFDELRIDLLTKNANQNILNQLSLLEGLRSHIEEFCSQQEISTWLSTDPERQRWDWQLRLYSLRLESADENKLREGEALRALLARATRESQRDDSSLDWYKSLNASEKTAALAQTVRLEWKEHLADEAGELSDLPVKRLATLTRIPGWQEALTESEQASIKKAIDTIEGKINESVDSELENPSRPFPDDLVKDLEDITQVKLSVFRELRRVFILIQEKDIPEQPEKWAAARKALEDIRSALDSDESGGGETSDDKPINLTLRARLNELNMLLLLRQPALDSAVATEVGGTLQQLLNSKIWQELRYATPHSFCDNLISRWENGILDARYAPMPLAGVVEDVLKDATISKALGTTLGGYQTWCKWVRAAESLIDESNTLKIAAQASDAPMSYGEWQELCTPFAAGSPVEEEVSPLLTALVGLFRVECTAVTRIGSESRLVLDNERGPFEEHLQVCEAHKYLRPEIAAYLKLCRVITSYAAAVRPEGATEGDTPSIPAVDTLVAETSRFTASLSNPSDRACLRARPQRIELCRHIVCEAIKARVAADPKENRLFAENPFCEGGAKAALDFFTAFPRLRDTTAEAGATPQDGTSEQSSKPSALTDEDLAYLCAAAAFIELDKVEPENAARAAIYADSLLDRWQDLPGGASNLPQRWQSPQNVRLISAWAHYELAMSGGVNTAVDADIAINRITAVISELGNTEPPDAANTGIRNAINQAKVLQRGIQLIEKSSIWPRLQEIQAADEAQDFAVATSGSSPRVVGNDDDLAVNAAEIYHAAASLNDFVDGAETTESADQGLDADTKQRYARLAYLLDRGNVRYLTQYVLLKLTGASEAESAEIVKRAAEDLKSVDPQCTESRIFQAASLYRSATLQTCTRDIVKQLQDANSLLDTWVDSRCVSRDEQVRRNLQALFLFTRAGIRFELANRLASQSASQRKETSLLLEQAILDCAELEKLKSVHDEVPWEYLVDAYITWGNALEDQEFLFRDVASAAGSIEKAIKRFEMAFETLKNHTSGRFESLALIQFNIARCQYRLYVAGRKPVIVREDVFGFAGEWPDSSQVTLTVADKCFSYVVDRTGSEYDKQRPEATIYKARICQELALASMKTLDRLPSNVPETRQVESDIDAQLAEADRLYDQAVELAKELPGWSRFNWKLEQSHCAKRAIKIYDTWIIAVTNVPDLNERQEQLARWQGRREHWQKRTRTITDELLALWQSARHGSGDVAASASEDTDRVVLSAIVSVVFEALHNIDEQQPYVDKALELLPVHMQAQLVASRIARAIFLRGRESGLVSAGGPSVASIQSKLEQTRKEDVARFTEIVKKMTEAGDEESKQLARVWQVRMDSLDAVMAWKQFSINVRSLGPGEANAKRMAEAGKNAFERLRDSIHRLKTTPQCGDGELVFLQYLLGLVAQELKGNRRLTETQKDNPNALNEIVRTAIVEVSSIIAPEDRWVRRQIELQTGVFGPWPPALIDAWAWGGEETMLLERAVGSAPVKMILDELRKK